MSSDRGMFDPNLPIQGIFDTEIFDTELAASTVTHPMITVLTHSTNTITALIHSTMTVVIK